MRNLSKTVLVVFGLSLVLFPLVASAQVATPALLTRILGVFTMFVQWFFLILIILAVLMLLYGAFLFLTAGGDEAKVGQARTTLIWALVGFGVAILAVALLRFVCELAGVACPVLPALF